MLLKTVPKTHIFWSLKDFSDCPSHLNRGLNYRNIGTMVFQVRSTSFSVWHNMQNELKPKALAALGLAGLFYLCKAPRVSQIPYVLLLSFSIYYLLGCLPRFL